MKNILMMMAIVFGVAAQANTETPVMIECTGAGYKLEVLENGYTYYTDAQLSDSSGSQYELSCSMYLGKPDAQWSCSEKSHQKTSYSLVLFGDELSRKPFPATLWLGKREIATLTCVSTLPY